MQFPENSDGEVRTLDEALDFAAREGVVIPDFVEVVCSSAGDRTIPDEADATYLNLVGVKPNSTFTKSIL